VAISHEGSGVRYMPPLVVKMTLLGAVVVEVEEDVDAVEALSCGSRSWERR